MIASAFDTDALVSRVSGVAVNPEAPKVDGKASVMIDRDLAPATVAGELLARLRTALPAAELAASWFAADTYVGGWTGEPGEDVSERTLLSSPPTADFPLARLCDLCRLDPAVEKVRLPKARTSSAHPPHARLDVGDDLYSESRVCRDCSRRNSQGDRRSGPEARLADRTACDQRVDDFGELASLGADKKGNHLATIYIDGNQLGRVFVEAAIGGVDLGGFASSVHSATLDALTAATHAVLEKIKSRPTLPVIPHVVGGDDVLVTVPAAAGWTFARRFLHEFNDASAAALASLGLAPLTAAAAVVFAHSSEPFSHVTEVAAERLKAAKRLVGASEASVSWTDLTQGRGTANNALSLRELENDASAIDALAAVDASRRGRLTRLATLDSGGDAAVARMVERLGVRAADPFLDGTENGLDRLLTALDLCRWWT